MSMKKNCVVHEGKVIHVGQWEAHVIHYDHDDGGALVPVATANPMPEGAVQGEFDIEYTTDGRIVLASDYRELRAAEYPSIGDQLDALFKGGAAAKAMADRLGSIKKKYPKP